MSLILTSLTITNFKGLQSLHMVFDKKENHIYGKNGAGKTTLFDAFRWLLDGKDSSDKENFQIKPIINGVQLERVDSVVEANLLWNDTPISLKKIHQEIWTRPGGKGEEVFKGNTNVFYWNDDVLTEKKYLSNMSEIIDITKLKLFSNVGYFNTMNPSDRRAILVDMAGVKDSTELINSNPDYAFIGDFLNQKKTFKEFKASIANNKKRTKDELAGKEPAIKELERQSALLQRPFGRLKDDLDKKELEFSGIETALNDKSIANKEQDERREALRKQKWQYENEAEVITNALATGIAAKFNKPDEGKLKIQQAIKTQEGALKVISEEIEQIKTRLSNGSKTVEGLHKELESAESSIISFRAQWDLENKASILFDEKDFSCPTCKRAFAESDQEAKKSELTASYNANKQTILDTIAGKGVNLRDIVVPNLKQDISKYNQAIETLNGEIGIKVEQYEEIRIDIDVLKDSLASYEPTEVYTPEFKESELKKQLDSNEEFKRIVNLGLEINEQMSSFEPVDNSVLINRKKELSTEIDELKKELTNKVQIASNVKRIDEIRKEQKELNQSLADLENQEMAMQEFVFKQMADVQQKVNSLFTFVQFQMFDKQVNGEIVDVCITLVDGKPVQKNAVNTAAEVNAGVDIINTLSKHYGVYLPMWVDKRESVTELLPSETQIINLSVNPAYETVTLVNK